ncbi:hypothetical protein [Janthinobacterium sp. PSPC3-1]|uniref:hypothetical protein n=1 Tax=Janthinobacterium sp. PSPC3-1 TaxID=2804653 RepID=UPI003CEB3253
MSWVAVAVVGGTVGGALITSKAAGKAANQQAEGTTAGLAENARQYDQTRADYAPYREAGAKALGTFATENDTPLDQSQVQLEPGYQFGLSQGQQAINRQTSAAGGRISGAALKAAAQYGTDYATSGYSAAYSRANQARSDRLNRLAALAQIGQTSTQNVSALGAETAASNNALTRAAANNAGAATLAQGNIWGNAGNQIAALYGRSAGTGSAAGGYADEMARINAQALSGG